MVRLRYILHSSTISLNPEVPKFLGIIGVKYFLATLRHSYNFSFRDGHSTLSLMSKNS